MAEVWRAIPGYEGIYEVSSLGRVRRLVQRYFRCVRPLGTPILVTSKRTGKYLGVDLSKDGVKTRIYLQRLVLLAFVGPGNEGDEAAHDDGDGLRNHLSNLAWKTPSANHMDKHRHGTMVIGEAHKAAKLTVDRVRAILADTRSNSAIAEAEHVSRTLIRQVKDRKMWKHV